MDGSKAARLAPVRPARSRRRADPAGAGACRHGRPTGNSRWPRCGPCRGRVPGRPHGTARRSSHAAARGQAPGPGRAGSGACRRRRGYAPRSDRRSAPGAVGRRRRGGSPQTPAPTGARAGRTSAGDRGSGPRRDSRVPRPSGAPTDVRGRRAAHPARGSSREGTTVGRRVFHCGRRTGSHRMPLCPPGMPMFVAPASRRAPKRFPSHRQREAHPRPL